MQHSKSGIFSKCLDIQKFLLGTSSRPIHWLQTLEKRVSKISTLDRVMAKNLGWIEACLHAPLLETL